MSETLDPATAGTGLASVDAALSELTRVAQAPPAEQITAYESAHRVLQETLQTIEQG